MKKNSKTKNKIVKILALILSVVLILSAMASSVLMVFATNETGVAVEIETENSSKTEEKWDDNTYEMEQKPILSKEEFMETLKESSSSENSTTQNSPAVVPDIVTTNATGEGVIVIKLEVPEEFYENVVVELYNRANGNVIQVPVYAQNKWEGKMSIPSGSYLVWNTMVTGDNAANPKWKFELGEKLEITENGSTNITIKYVNGDEQSANKPTGEVTDTKLSKEDLTPENEKERTVGQLALDILKGLVTGGNLILLLSIAVCFGALWIIKKVKEKKEENS